VASFQQRVWNASRGVLEPSSRQKVAPAIYDEMRMSRGVSNVVFDNVVILVGFTIRNNSASGTIIVPEGTTTIDLGGGQVNVLYRAWSQICEQYNA
jgi:hypothetical protein